MSFENRMIFIVGNSRSGTTMLGRIMNQHSEIYTFHELHFFEQLVDSSSLNKETVWPVNKLVKMLERLLTSERDGYFSTIVDNKYTQEAREQIKLSNSQNPGEIYSYFLNNEAKINGKKIPCEQTPRYLFSADEILELYPKARIINMVRDPRAILLSQKNKWKRRFLGANNIPLFEAFRSWSNYHPVVISKLWSACIKKAGLFRDEKRFLTVKFEKILTEPEKTVKEICKYLNIKFQIEMINIPNVGSSQKQDMPDVKGLDESKTNAWKNGGLTNTEIALVESISGEEMKLFDYLFLNPEKSDIRMGFSYITVFFKLSLSLLLNLKRHKNILSTVKRRLAN